MMHTIGLILPIFLCRLLLDDAQRVNPDVPYIQPPCNFDSADEVLVSLYFLPRHALGDKPAVILVV